MLTYTKTSAKHSEIYGTGREIARLMKTMESRKALHSIRDFNTLYSIATRCGDGVCHLTLFKGQWLFQSSRDLLCCQIEKVYNKIFAEDPFREYVNSSFFKKLLNTVGSDRAYDYANRHAAAVRRDKEN